MAGHRKLTKKLIYDEGTFFVQQEDGQIIETSKVKDPRLLGIMKRNFLTGINKEMLEVHRAPVTDANIDEYNRLSLIRREAEQLSF